MLKWKKVKTEKLTYWTAGVFRISKIGARSYALVSVEPIKMSKGYSFLAYLDFTLAGAKDEAQIHADNQDEKSDH